MNCRGFEVRVGDLQAGESFWSSSSGQWETTKGLMERSDGRQVGVDGFN